MNADALLNGSIDDAKAIADHQRKEDLKRQRRLDRQIRQELDAEERPTFDLEVMDEAAFDALPAANWIVHGLILEAGLGLVVGEPGSLKTFTVLDLALSIASGQQTWLGRKLNRHGAVVYVVAEGQGRFKYRKAVWKQEHRVTGPLPFYIVRRPIDLRNAAMMEAFLKQIDSLHPVLVVFDTLNRSIPGAEENSAKEFGEAIAACNIIQQATGASVQLLHHPKKDGTSSRGSGAGLGAVESELWMKKTADKNLFTLSVGKQKEGDDDFIINLKKRVVELAGVYEPDSGEPVTSCVVELADASDIAKANGKLERQILDFVANHPNVKKGDVAGLMGMKKPTVDATIEALILDSKLSQTPGGRGGKAKLLNLMNAVRP